MTRMRFKKMFPQDIIGPLQQLDFTKFIRPGVVDNINTADGTCDISWLDRPGIKIGVLLTQSSPREWTAPQKGDVVLCGFDSVEQARILRYVNLGQAKRSVDVSLPLIKEGERLWEAGDSFIYMKANGDIQLFTLSGGTLLLSNLNRTYSATVGNFQIKTDAGTSFFGQLKRMVPDPLNPGGLTLKVIQDLTLQELNEQTLNVFEHAPSSTDLVTPPTPIFSIAMGTFVGPVDSRVPLDPLAGQTLAWSKSAGAYIKAPVPTKEVMCRIRLKSGVQLDIDKEGRLSIQGVKLNVNDGQVDTVDPDVALGLEIPSTKGTRGQHAAREHDAVTIPIGSGFTDPAHLGLTAKSNANLQVLQALAAAIISPAGPCSLNPAVLPPTLKFQGEVTEGADSVYVGDTGITPGGV